MKIKKFLLLFLACVGTVGALSLTASADSGYPVLRLEDMSRDLIDVSTAAVLEENSMRATGSLNSDIPANTLAVSNIKFSLGAGETVTINCSYSPASASMDFGVIAPDGYFYFLNIKEGSINQSIVVSQRGTYTLAIRNNSSNVVHVAGFVNY